MFFCRMVDLIERGLLIINNKLSGKMYQFTQNSNFQTSRIKKIFVDDFSIQNDYFHLISFIVGSSSGKYKILLQS